MNNFSLSFQSGYLFLYIIIGLAAIGISWWSYKDLVPQISRLKRLVLISLRSLGILLIAILLIEPLTTLYTEEISGNKLGVVVDMSSSMLNPEKDRRRYEIAESLYASYQPGNVSQRYFGFADSVYLLNGLPDSISINGQATNISQALLEPIALSDKELGALLILTDGAGNLGLDPLKTAASIDIPVYSLVVGSALSQKDIYISKIDCSPVGYTNTEIPLEVEIASFGYSGEPAVLEIRDENRVLLSRRIALPADGAYATIEFKLNLAGEGIKNLRTVIGAREDEANADNNIRAFTIKLLKDKIKVLLLSSTLNWELTYLKKALGQDSYLQVDLAISNSRGGIAAADLPPSLENWKDIDLIIALDLSARALGPQLANVKAAIESGTGFLYFAGAKSRIIRLGDWDELLPVKSNSLVSVEDGEFFPLPGRQAIVRAVTDIEGLRWDDLKPLSFMIRGLELDPAAVVFLDVIGARGEHWAILAGGRFNRGKTAAITGYPWWPRYFQPASGNTEIKKIEKFWSNLVRWLVARDDLEKFNLASSKPVYKLGEPVGFAATLFDDSYNLVGGAKIDVVITDSTGAQRELQLTGHKAGEYSGIFGSPAAGKYDFTARAFIQSDTLGTARGSFIVESFSLEMENPSANYALMEQIATITGGMCFTSENFSEFSQNLKLNLKRSDVFSEYRLTGNKYLLIIIILLFTLEWGIRKFSQLA